MFDVVDVKQDLREVAGRLQNLRGSLDLDLKTEQIADFEEKMTAPDFWDDNDRAQKLIAEMNAVKSVAADFEALNTEYEDLATMLELVEEEQDESMVNDLRQGTKVLVTKLEAYELQLLLNQPYDRLNAILELHPGAGGTESQDWAEQLLRMYRRWAEKRGFKVEVLDYLPGDEAGVKSVTLLIKGYNAYGYLKVEKGVHRLVRISPFDASGRRHTSFVSCDVVPEIDDTIDIEIRSEDLKVDTYRSSGAGGQHINTTDSAVRITHMPTGIVVSCQNERSQIKNRERAMTMLRSKLYERRIEEQKKELAEIRGVQSDIAWGSQIRSYVFHPYSMVKDHRTGAETGNVGSVMDGEIDFLIDAALRGEMNKNPDDDRE
ncbi:peptide chain release factor 2 [Gorillibacterium timonense]|uniref:peptide chain release factor 2 n=1 Tax=Gorillibacterium timonense TaxID=1689269 RepID=UPI001652AC38|nr:peptide chain release factor 2 [Gorillibacterium timonense]